jgi:hypothetical protein
MDAQTFIDAIRSEVQTSASKGCIKQYTDGPPGRSPRPDLVALSDWYRGQSEADRQMVEKVAADVSHAAVFGFLCVLDGVRAIEDYGPVRLNPPQGMMLHEVLNAV